MATVCYSTISQQQNWMSNLGVCLEAAVWLILQISLQQNVSVLILLTFL